jgi:aminoglycoside 6'-N-acetyltransferase I
LDEITAFDDAGTIVGLPSAVFVVARDNTTLGGFVEVSLRPFANGCVTTSVGYLEGWYVDPDLRRSGLGGQLVRAAEQWAIERGCTEMASDCVAGNKISYLAHQQLGYRPTDPHVLFKKPLSANRLERLRGNRRLRPRGRHDRKSCDDIRRRRN